MTRPASVLGAVALLFALVGATAGVGAADPETADIEAGPEGGLFDRLFGRGRDRQGAPAPVPPEQAFVLTARAAPPGELALRFDVHDCCYLYRDRLRFELRDTAGEPLAAASGLRPRRLPPAETVRDPYFGPSAVYRKSVELRLPLRALPAGGRFALEVTYQGCSEKGVVLCYEPLVQRVHLRRERSEVKVDGTDPPRPAG